MNEVLNKYDLLILKLNEKEKRYIHFQSLKNFIAHIEDIGSIDEKKNCIYLLLNYIDYIESNYNEIGKLSSFFYVNHVYKIADTFFIKKGFKEMHQLRFELYLSIIFDILIDVFLLHYPYPILTLIVTINYFIKRKKYKNSSKLFGMYY